MKSCEECPGNAPVRQFVLEDGEVRPVCGDCLLERRREADRRAGRELPVILSGTRCSNHYWSSRCASRKARVWMHAPDGTVIPGGPHCRKCAVRVTDEYAEKLGEKWGFYEAVIVQ